MAEVGTTIICAECGGSLIANAENQKYHKECSNRVRQRTWRERHVVKTKRKAIVKKARLPRLGSKARPMLVAQCPSCRAYRAVEALPKTREAAQCETCRKAGMPIPEQVIMTPPEGWRGAQAA